MRILTVGNLYPPHHHGGYELTWRSAVAEMRARGHTVRVLTTDHRNPGVPEQAGEGDVYRELRWYWRDHEFPRRRLRERLGLERHNRAVFERHVRELDPHVVSWWPMGGMSMSLVARWAHGGRPAVGVVEDDWMVYGPLVDAWTQMWSRRWAPARPTARALDIPTRPDLGGAAHWIFASERTRRAAADHNRLASSEVVHLGIDHSLFRPAPVSAWRWRLLYLGRIDPRKGIATAIEALQLLPPEATLTIAGSGDDAHASELRALVTDLSLTDRVEFVSRPRAEVPALYADADVLLFPVQWDEPWGLVPLEAMAVGTPVVATGTGGSGEYLRHEHNCLIFDRDAGPEGLSAAVARLAAEPPLVRALRDRGFETAGRFREENFNRAVAAAIERQVAS